MINPLRDSDLASIEGTAYVGVTAQVEHDAPTVIAVQRLEDHGVADAVGQPDRIVDRTHRLRSRNRQPSSREQRESELLVAGDVNRNRGRLRGHRGPNPFLMDSLAELHERGGVEPQIGNVAAHRLLDDRLGGRPESGPLAADDEPLQRLVEVEVRIGDDQVVDQPDGQLAGGQPDRLVVVGVDHVVAATLALDLPGLAAAHVVADGLLQLQRHVLGDVANPGALV